MWKYVKSTQAPTKIVPSGQSWDNFSKKINKIVPDYDPKHKINIHESC